MRLFASLLLAIALAWIPLARGLQAPAKRPASKSTSGAKKKSAGSKRTASKKSSSKKSAPKKTVRKQNEPDAERSREIQEALAREGYLTSKPSGKWDSATSEALARYQKDQGLPATGKPESRALIKLGLGGPNHTQ